jgi:hypothetical protein
MAHLTYYRAGIFTGPSLPFHLGALEAGKGADLSRFAESVYALLAAWRMHRMGRGGSNDARIQGVQGLAATALTYRFEAAASLAG